VGQGDGGRRLADAAFLVDDGENGHGLLLSGKASRKGREGGKERQEEKT
jgi:hypothetical protein